jgi:hypothetical protein
MLYLRKAICQVFDRKMCVKIRSLDMDQNAVTSILLNEHKDSQGKWPTNFTGKTYQFYERNFISYWLTTLSLKELKTRQDIEYFKKDINAVNPVSAYLLVYRDPHVGLHCIFITKYDLKTRKLHCMNSHGTKNQNPEIPLRQKDNVFL